VRVSIWFEKYPTDTLMIWQLKEQNWFAKIPDWWPVLVLFYYLCACINGFEIWRTNGKHL